MRRVPLLLVALVLAALLLPAIACAEPGRPVLLRVTQINAAGTPLTTPRETLCPPDGCAMAGEMKLASGMLSFNTVVTFVADGAYVALTALPPGAARIREFSRARPAPVFLQASAASNGTTLIRLVVDRIGTPSLLTGEPDAYLRVEFAPAPVLPQAAGPASTGKS
jgi:hypothetical protein